MNERTAAAAAGVDAFALRLDQAAPAGAAKATKAS